MAILFYSDLFSHLIWHKYSSSFWGYSIQSMKIMSQINNDNDIIREQRVVKGVSFVIYIFFL
jgi:hypothetical protein